MKLSIIIRDFPRLLTIILKYRCRDQQTVNTLLVGKQETGDSGHMDKQIQPGEEEELGKLGPCFDNYSRLAAWPYWFNVEAGKFEVEVDYILLLELLDLLFEKKLDSFVDSEQ